MSRLDWERARLEDHIRRASKSKRLLTPLQMEAVRRARQYKGSFGFMLKMQKLARKGDFFPTTNMCFAILRSTEPKPTLQRR